MNDFATTERTYTQAELESRTEAAARQALIQYKERVLEAALIAKRENNWCSDGFRSTLAEIGIEIPSVRYTVTLDLKVQFDVELDGSLDEDQADEFLRDSFLEDLDFNLEPRLRYSKEQVEYIHSASIENVEVDGVEES